MKSMGGARASILRSHHLRWYRRKWHNALSGGFAHGLHVEGRCTTAFVCQKCFEQLRSSPSCRAASSQPPKRSARCRHPRGHHATPRPSTITHGVARRTQTRRGKDVDRRHSRRPIRKFLALSPHSAGAFRSQRLAADTPVLQRRRLTTRLCSSVRQLPARPP